MFFNSQQLVCWLFSFSGPEQCASSVSSSFALFWSTRLQGEAHTRAFHCNALVIIESLDRWIIESLDDWINHYQIPDHCSLRKNAPARYSLTRSSSYDHFCLIVINIFPCPCLRMKSVANSEPFLKPVDPVQFPAYKDYISCPMDLQV